MANKSTELLLPAGNGVAASMPLDGRFEGALIARLLDPDQLPAPLG